MEKQRGMKTLSLVALIVAVLGLTVAFAAMSRTLTINGTATVDAATWDIHYANLSEAELTGAASVDDVPSISTDGTHFGDFKVVLTKPGDSVTYKFDVVNAGSIDAKITSLIKGDNVDSPVTTPTCTGVSATNAAADAKIVCDNLTYTFTYDDGTAVALNDELAAAADADTPTVKHLVLTVAYKADATELPSDDVEITDLGITTVYSQN